MSAGRSSTVPIGTIAAGALLLSALVAGAAKRPNILLIVADDVGWADVGYHGSPIKTPVLDRLAAAGVELDRHYVAPMCTPTRAALLTGRYWSRFGNTKPSNERVLPFGTVTLAAALRAVGYDTAITGKWHLGSRPKWGPRKFGFHRSHGSLAGGVGPLNHLYKRGQYSRTWHRNDALLEEPGHVTDLIAAEAVRFIEAERDGPFFLYVPFTAAHVPFDEPQEYLDASAHIPAARRQYAASVTHMDAAIGRMIEALEKTGRRDETLIVFFSDNGGTKADGIGAYPGTYPPARVFGLNRPLRGGKREVYEGGIRTPALVHWPKRLTARKVTAPLHAIDWMPTLCRLAGYDPPENLKNLKWDGLDILPVLTGQTDAPSPRPLYCLGVSGRSAALHSGGWKLVVHGVGKKERAELYDLAADPNETTDLAARHPDRVRSLRAILEREMAKDNDAAPKR